MSIKLRHQISEKASEQTIFYYLINILIHIFF